LRERVLQNAFLPSMTIDTTLNLPAYIPYIGSEYFNYRPRVLCFAINQNLSRHAPWAKSWMSRWHADAAVAGDRLNDAVQRGEQIPIRPYAEGFIPLMGLMAIGKWIKQHGGVLPEYIDDVISVTNFVKFSTESDASSSSIPPSWWKECADLYVRYEIELLAPDLIIAVGRKTGEELARILRIYFDENVPELLVNRFPTRIASISSKIMSSRESKVWNEELLPLLCRIRRARSDDYFTMRAHRFPWYFLQAKSEWNSPDCK